MSDVDQTAKMAELETKLAEQAERIGELSKENAKWRRQAQGKDVPPEAQERINQLEEQLDAQKSALTEAQKLAKKASTDAETFRKQLQDAEGFTQRLLVDNGLTEALAKAGVTNAAHMKAVKAMLASQVQVVAEGDAKVAKVGDKSLVEFVQSWATGDEGKYFVSAPVNSGGGANSSNGGAPKLPANMGEAKTKQDKIALAAARLEKATAKA
jgi:uncharacterized coiled-coil protein SlyX